MDDKTKQIIEIGEKYIDIIKNDPVLALDYSDESIENVQAWVASLKDSGTDDSYQSKAMIGLAVYLGKMWQKKFPNFEFNVIFKGKEVDEIQIKDNKGNVHNLLTWVRKCYSNPKEENIAFKFKAAVKMFQNPPVTSKSGG